MTHPLDTAQQIGFVELLITRSYQDDTDQWVEVSPGRYPLMQTPDGVRWWTMTGRKVSIGNTVERLSGAPGDGLFAMTPTVKRGGAATVHSAPFTEAEWVALVTDPMATEGDPEQRLRIEVFES